MSGANPLPRVGDVFLDARGEDRALRLSRHEGDGLVILSLWRRGVCTGTFRLPDTELPALLGALSELAEPCAATRVGDGPPAGPRPAPDRLVFPVTDEHPRLSSAP